MTLTVTIDRCLDDPVYEQVAAQIRQFVASGALEPGTALPSVRGLAANLGVNLNTIARAYRLLEGEGFLVIRDRSGVVVAAPAEEVERTTRDKLHDELRSTLARLRQAGMVTDTATQLALHEFLAADRPMGDNGDE